LTSCPWSRRVFMRVRQAQQRDAFFMPRPPTPLKLTSRSTGQGELALFDMAEAVMVTD
jgi:hypothetical protein